MVEGINVLILSCGVRNKIVQYFKHTLSGCGSVIATDCSCLAPALYDADKYYIVPEVGSEDYLDTIFSICKDNNVQAILSLIDPELDVLAENIQAFQDIGVSVIVSDPEVIDLCLNKYAMHQFLLEHGFKTIKTYIEKDDFYNDLTSGRISFPVLVKPVNGSASINVFKVDCMEEVELLFMKSNKMIIQEYIDGVEYGADVYIDLISSEPVAIFTKEKIKMRAGETDKSRSMKDEKLFQLIINFVNAVGFRGIIDIDLFLRDGEYYILEVNPRFGGGYPHAHECGVDVPQMIVNNLRGIINDNIVGRYDDNVYMMKYSEIKIEH